VRLSSVVSLALLTGLLLVAPGAVSPAHAVACPASPYPGDDAPKAAIAAWMAGGAGARGVPGELPVMAALVESGLANLDHGSADAKGYFQMRASIWDKGEYAGYADTPDLQLDWFLDQATAVRTPPYPADTEWGEWAADVERPAAKNRGKYQLRLADARALLVGCGVADTTPPSAQVDAPAEQKAVKRHGVRVPVGCPAEACTAAVSAQLKVRWRPELTVPARTLAPGEVTTFRLKLRGAVRRLVLHALQHGGRPRVAVSVTTTDQAGNAAVATTTVRITG